MIVGIMLGSMGRTINSSALFFPALVAGVVLVGMHWLLAMVERNGGISIIPFKDEPRFSTCLSRTACRPLASSSTD